MKQRLLMIAAVLLVLCSAAQEKKVDFLKLDNLKDKYQYGSKVKVKLENVNRFLFKVSTDKTETDYNTTPPAIMGSIKLPAFINTALPAVSAGALPSTVTKNGSRTLSNVSSEIEKTLEELNKSQVLLNKAILAHNSCVNISRQCARSFDDIRKDVQNALDAFLKEFSIAVGTTIAEDGDKIFKLLADNTRKSNELNDNLAMLVDEWNQKRLEAFRKTQRESNENLAALKQQLDDLNEKYKSDKPVDQPATLAKIRENEKNTRSLESDIKEAQENYENEKSVQTSNLEKAGKLLVDINTYKDETGLYTLTNDLKKINESNYAYTSETVEMKKDEIKIKFTVTADDRLTCNTANEQQFEVELNTTSGCKIDFSAGIFINGGSKLFLGEEYYYKTLNDTQTVIKPKDAGKRVMPSIGALMHIYKRSEANVKLGGSVGVSTTADFTNLNFHLGASLLIGKKDRIIVTGGLTLREIDILDRNYATDVTYITKQLPQAVPTIKKFPETGWFISLTYNFSAFNK